MSIDLGIGRRGRDAALLLGVAVAQGAEYDDCGEAGLDEEFAAVQPVYWGIFQGGVGEETVPEERGSSDVNGEVKGFPNATAETDAQIRRDNHDRDNIERKCADGVVERLARGVHGVEEIDDAEPCRFVEEQNDGMNNGERESQIAGDVVQAEIIKAAMRPLADGTVTEGHQGAEQHVEGDGSDGG